MEKEVLITAMKTSISEVLETMFFLPLEFPDEVNPEQLWGPQKEEPVVGKLTFSGPFTGDLLYDKTRYKNPPEEPTGRIRPPFGRPA